MSKSTTYEEASDQRLEYINLLVFTELRVLCYRNIALFLPMLVMFFFVGCSAQKDSEIFSEFSPELIVQQATAYLDSIPVTITSFVAERSEGGLHDYYSEGPYWWEDPENPEGPYIRKDGQRNPSNFTAHRSSLKRMEQIVVSQAAAYTITKDSRFSQAVEDHLNAWFVNPATRINPSLLYAQAIKGISSGRGIGIIDVIGLIDVSNAIRVLHQEGQLSEVNYQSYEQWFDDFATWLTTHPYGDEEKNNDNNHSTWWGAQIAAYSILADRADIFNLAIEQFKSQLAIQLADDGSFPHEMKRTKPWHYMNYTVEAWTTFALLLDSPKFDPWAFETENGTLEKASEFAYQFHKNPESWKFYTDLEKTIKVKAEDYLWMTAEATSQAKYRSLWNDLREKNEIDRPQLLLWDYLLNSKMKDDGEEK